MIDLKASAIIYIACIFFFKPDASSWWQLWQLQLSVGEILLRGIKNFNLSRVVVIKVVLSFYLVCLTLSALQKSELSVRTMDGQAILKMK